MLCTLYHRLLRLYFSNSLQINKVCPFTVYNNAVLWFTWHHSVPTCKFLFTKPTQTIYTVIITTVQYHSHIKPAPCHIDYTGPSKCSLTHGRCIAPWPDLQLFSGLVIQQLEQYCYIFNPGWVRFRFENGTDSAMGNLFISVWGISHTDCCHYMNGIVDWLWHEMIKV